MRLALFDKWLPFTPRLSLVVVAYNMQRELPRTLYSLSPAYQIGVDAGAYEVIVVDNGSNPPFGKQAAESFGAGFRYFYLSDAPPSPAYAVNFGVRHARGEIIGLMIDGARIVSPGVVHLALAAFAAFGDPTVGILGWHLGPKLQNLSIAEGYDQEQEDRLLESINFPQDGYRLFEISVLAGSCSGGWFAPMGESNCIFVRRNTYWQLGGFDERFDLPGGGLINLDFYRRAVLRPQAKLVILLGEGTFHQVHGGIATNGGEAELRRNIEKWRAQYRMLRGEDFTPPKKRPIFLGYAPYQILASLEASARNALTDPGVWE